MEALETQKRMIIRQMIILYLRNLPQFLWVSVAYGVSRISAVLEMSRISHDGFWKFSEFLDC